MGGNFKEEEFTPEELTELGREPEKSEKDEEEEVKAEGQDNPEGEVKADVEAKTDETDKAIETEKKAVDTRTEDEKQAMEAKGLRIEDGYIVDDEGTKIPAKRWKEIYGDYKEAKRESQSKQEKFDLFKRLGAEEYYRVFPAEAPADYRAPEKRETPAPSNADPMQLRVTGGDYDGMTLQEVKEVDPFSAAMMLTEWKEGQRAAVEAERSRSEQMQHEQESEATQFGIGLAKEIWGVDDPDKITPEQQKEILSVGQKVIAWQEKNHCLHYSWSDAYKLMTMDERIAKARAEGGKGTLKNLTERKGPASISTSKGGDVKETGFEAVEKMSDSQLAAHIDKLDEKEMLKFLTEAPKSLKAKHPDLPWR